VAKTPLLVLGLGNVLCSDDGLGIAAVTELQRTYEPADGVEIMDGGTLGLSLLPILMDAEQVILVDAIDTGEPPGTPVRVEGSDVIPAARERLSPHQVGVADLLDGATLCESYPSRVILLGVVPRSTSLGTELAPEVAARVPDLIQRVVAEIRSLGFELAHRDVAVSSPAGRRTGISSAPVLLGM
jgi:hydrogenase maturation protease